MAINISTRVITKNFVVPLKGALAIYLSKAVLADGLDKVVLIRSLNELEASFPITVNSSDDAKKELKVMEYALLNRVPIVAIVEDVDFITDLATLELDEEIVGFVAPFNTDLNYNITSSGLSPAVASADQEALVNFIKKYAASAYIELEIATADIEEIDNLVDSDILPVLDMQVELAYGEFEYNYESSYVVDDFYMPASVALAIKKSRRYITDLPWIPVAGQDNGKILNISKLKNSLTKSRKNILQDLGANVLDFKRGVGYFFASQNTLVEDRDKNPDNPLIRSHIVHLRNLIHSELEREAGYFLYKPNNTKTKTLFDLKLNSLFSKYVGADAIHRYDIATGDLVLTAEEILKGTLLKAVITYRPVNAIEDITVELYITNTDVSLVDILEGVE